jgi:hypothetical protein
MESLSHCHRRCLPVGTPILSMEPFSMRLMSLFRVLFHAWLSRHPPVLSMHCQSSAIPKPCPARSLYPQLLPTVQSDCTMVVYHCISLIVQW